MPPIDGIDQWDVLMKPNATSVESLRIGPFASIISHVLRSKVAAVNFTQTRSGQVIRTKQPDKTLSVCVCIFLWVGQRCPWLSVRTTPVAQTTAIPPRRAAAGNQTVRQPAAPTYLSASSSIKL